jgi:hypothetical protein
MSLTRSQFLARMAAGAAALALRPFPALAGLPGGVDGPETAWMTRQGFERFVGETFLVDPGDGGGPVSLVLERVEARPSTRGNQQFSLYFVSPEGTALQERTYPVEGRETAPFALFLSPVGRDARGRTSFRADFNHLLTADAPRPPKL